MGLLMTIRSPETSGRSQTIVELSGEADLNDSAALREMLAAQAADPSAALILDLSRLRFIDSAALHVILVAGRALITRGGAFALAAPQEPVRRILQLSGADRLVPVYETVEAAKGRGHHDGRPRPGSS
ncbi:MAG TPA: STAS domain-containing protein [Trebonia sp.]|nr:STAS domain-containing protein [Trebonia sp.]